MLKYSIYQCFIFVQLQNITTWEQNIVEGRTLKVGFSSQMDGLQ